MFAIFMPSSHHLRERQAGCRLDTCDGQIKDIAEKVKLLRLVSARGLPESLRTVKTSAVRQSLQGGSQTLRSLRSCHGCW